jgi:methionyl-tRNA formyltransferase
MTTFNKFSCSIIGEGILPIRCAEILLEGEQTIYGIISSNGAVNNWAREREIPHIDPEHNGIVTFLSQRPFDYLFSIVNTYILSKQVLELPRRCAINYHDAPLPRYAGSYATSWAIMQDLNERTFFSRYKRPSSGCLLTWNRSARDISAFVRALDFGSHPNPLGLPKLAIVMDFIIVAEVEVLNSMSAVPSGTITHIDPGFVRVSTLDGEIALRKLLTIDGQPLTISDFVAKLGLYVGYQFEELERETVPMPVPTETLNPLENRSAPWSTGDFLLAAFAA